MTIEQALVALLVLLVLLINFVMPALRRMVQEQARERPETRRPTVVARRRIIPVEQAPQVPQGVRRAPVTFAPTVPLGRSRPLSLRDVRRGVVLMAVLGNCRGIESTGRSNPRG